MATAQNLQVGLRLTADATSLRAGTQQGVREVERLTQSTQRTTQQSQQATQHTNRFSTAMRNAASSTAVLHGPLGGIASRFSGIATLATRSGLAMTAAGLAASGAVFGYVSFARAAGQAEQQLLGLEGRLQATGYAAGVTLAEINAFARQLAEDTLTSTGEARDAARELLGFSSITRDRFFEVLSLGQDMGGSLVANVQQLGRVLEAPEEGLGRLSRRMSDLSFEQQRMIDEMVASGREMEAMGVIIDHVRGQIGGTGVAEAGGLNGALDTLGERWTRLKENLGDTTAIKGATNALSSLLGGVNEYLEVRAGLQDDGFSSLPGPLGIAVTALQMRRGTDNTSENSVDDSEVDALEAQRLAAEAAAKRRLDSILEIEAEANDARVELERSANDDIIAERDRQLATLANLADDANGEEIARAQAAVQARAAAALEEADRPAREAAQRRAEADAERAASQSLANQQVIQGLERERALLESLAGTERDRAQAMDAAAGQLNEFASPAQVERARALAAAIHDAMDAEQRQADTRAAEQDLSQRIAQQQLLAEFGGQETEEYRVQAALLALKQRIGESAATQLQEQVRLAQQLTTANQEQAQQQQQLEQILYRANPVLALERQLALIEELKTQYPEYAAALEVASEQVRERIDAISSGLLNASNINRQFSYGAANGLDSFAEDIANGRNAIDSFADAFRQFAADFLRQIAQMIIQQMIFNALQNSAGGGVGGFVSGLFGGGGGGGASAAAGGIYANLPTFHGGGVVGAGGSQTRLAPDEMLTLQRRGEEVLTTADPRHRNNQGGQGRSGETAIYNMIDGDSLAQAVMASPQGRRGIINVIKADKGQIKTILGN